MDDSYHSVGWPGTFLAFARYRSSWAHGARRWALYGRLWGRGLHFSNKRRGEALFSERYGHTRVWYFLGLRLEVLRPLTVNPKDTAK